MVTLTAVPQARYGCEARQSINLHSSDSTVEASMRGMSVNNPAIAADIVRFSAKCLRQIDVLSRSKDNALPGLNVRRYRP